jgi:hypothetical protein
VLVGVDDVAVAVGLPVEHVFEEPAADDVAERRGRRPQAGSRHGFGGIGRDQQADQLGAPVVRRTRGQGVHRSSVVIGSPW